MGMSFVIKKNILPALLGGMAAKAGDVLEAGAEDTRAEVQATAPRDTGKLADGYYTTRTGESTVELRSGDDVDYAAAVELGHRQGSGWVPPQPHFYPACLNAGDHVAAHFDIFTAWLEGL